MSSLDSAIGEGLDGPVVLLVEDMPGQRADRAGELLGEGCVPVQVESVDAAARELIASPGIDLVMTDIHLVPREEGDKSGIELARFVRRSHPEMPIVGYSAYFSEGDLADEDLALFDERYVKARSIRDMRISIERCAELARESQMRRKRDAAIKLAGADGERLTEGDLVDDAVRLSLEKVRSLELASSEDVERILDAAGFSLRLVRLPGVGMRDPLIVWIREHDGHVDAEVYGQPALYVDAQSEEAAFARLADLIHAYASEFRALDPAVLSGPAARLNEYLASLNLVAEGG